MRTYQNYMETPEIATEPLFLLHVHTARLRMQNETRDLSQEEWLDYWKKKEQELIREYGIENPLSAKDNL